MNETSPKNQFIQQKKNTKTASIRDYSNQSFSLDQKNSMLKSFSAQALQCMPTPTFGYGRKNPQTGVLSSAVAPLTRHHIIPIGKVPNFILTIFGNGTYGRIKNQTKNFLKESINRLLPDNQSAAYQNANNYINQDNNAFFDPNIDETIQHAISWLPGNIFLGPSGRVDDPGDSFDNAAQGIVDDVHFNKLTELNKKMDNYNINQTQVELARQILKDLLELAEIKEPYEYNETHWTTAWNLKKTKRGPKRKGSITKVTK